MALKENPLYKMHEHFMRKKSRLSKGSRSEELSNFTRVYQVISNGKNVANELQKITVTEDMSTYSKRYVKIREKLMKSNEQSLKLYLTEYEDWISRQQTTEYTSTKLNRFNAILNTIQISNKLNEKVLRSYSSGSLNKIQKTKKHTINNNIFSISEGKNCEEKIDDDKQDILQDEGLDQQSKVLNENTNNRLSASQLSSGFLSLQNIQTLKANFFSIKNAILAIDCTASHLDLVEQMEEAKKEIEQTLNTLNKPKEIQSSVTPEDRWLLQILHLVNKIDALNIIPNNALLPGQIKSLQNELRNNIEGMEEEDMSSKAQIEKNIQFSY